MSNYIYCKCGHRITNHEWNVTEQPQPCDYCKDCKDFAGVSNLPPGVEPRGRISFEAQMGFHKSKQYLVCARTDCKIRASACIQMKYASMQYELPLCPMHCQQIFDQWVDVEWCHTIEELEQ